jgi:hypothetical protein
MGSNASGSKASRSPDTPTAATRSQPLATREPRLMAATVESPLPTDRHDGSGERLWGNGPVATPAPRPGPNQQPDHRSATFAANFRKWRVTYSQGRGRPPSRVKTRRESCRRRPGPLAQAHGPADFLRLRLERDRTATMWGHGDDLVVTWSRTAQLPDLGNGDVLAAGRSSHAALTAAPVEG